MIEVIPFTILVLLIAAILIVIVYYSGKNEKVWENMSREERARAEQLLAAEVNYAFKYKGETKMNKEQALAKIKELEKYIKDLDKPEVKPGQIWLMDDAKRLVTLVTSDSPIDLVHTLDISELDGVEGILRSSYFPLKYFLRKGRLLAHSPGVAEALSRIQLEFVLAE